MTINYHPIVFLFRINTNHVSYFLFRINTNHVSYFLFRINTKHVSYFLFRIKISLRFSVHNLFDTNAPGFTIAESNDLFRHHQNTLFEFVKAFICGHKDEQGR